MDDDTTVPEKSNQLPEADTRPPDTSAWRTEARLALRPVVAGVIEQGQQEHAVDVPVGRFDISVSPAEQSLILSLGEGVLPQKEHQRLQLDRLGIEARVASALDSEASPGQNEGLREFITFGYQLTRAMTVEIRRLREHGNDDEAAALMDGRTRLSSMLNEADKACPAPEKKAKPAERPAQHRFVYEWDSSGKASTEPRRPAPSSAPRSRPAPDPNRHAGVKRLALVALVVVLAVVLGRLWVMRPRQLRDFSPEQFPTVPGIEQVINRSPDLIIVVRDAPWEAADLIDHKAAVDGVVTLIEPAGYRGLEIRSATDPLLASWYSGEGIVIDQ